MAIIMHMGEGEKGNLPAKSKNFCVSGGMLAVTMVVTELSLAKKPDILVVKADPGVEGIGEDGVVIS